MSHIYLYLLSSSSPSLFYQRQVFDGNNDVFSFMSVTNLFPVAFMARYVRIVIKEWEAWPAMRFEILGCQGTWAINPSRYTRTRLDISRHNKAN